MKETCIGYYKRGDKFLFIYRNKKTDDIHEGKYLGIGGHLEAGEDPDQAMQREFLEETGLAIVEYRKLGSVIYREQSERWPTNHMHVYFIYSVEGEMIQDCTEGVLTFLTAAEYAAAPHWPADDIWQKDALADLPIGTVQMNYDSDQFVGFEHLQ